MIGPPQDSVFINLTAIPTEAGMAGTGNLLRRLL
jgi:hypothetical protein